MRIADSTINSAPFAAPEEATAGNATVLETMVQLDSGSPLSEYEFIRMLAELGSLFKDDYYLPASSILGYPEIVKRMGTSIAALELTNDEILSKDPDFQLLSVLLTEFMSLYAAKMKQMPYTESRKQIERQNRFRQATGYESISSLTTHPEMRQIIRRIDTELEIASDPLASKTDHDLEKWYARAQGIAEDLFSRILSDQLQAGAVPTYIFEEDYAIAKEARRRYRMRTIPNVHIGFNGSYECLIDGKPIRFIHDLNNGHFTKLDPLGSINKSQGILRFSHLIANGLDGYRAYASLEARMYLLRQILFILEKKNLPLDLPYRSEALVLKDYSEKLSNPSTILTDGVSVKKWEESYGVLGRSIHHPITRIVSLNGFELEKYLFATVLLSPANRDLLPFLSAYLDPSIYSFPRLRIPYVYQQSREEQGTDTNTNTDKIELLNHTPEFPEDFISRESIRDQAAKPAFIAEGNVPLLISYGNPSHVDISSATDRIDYTKLVRMDSVPAVVTLASIKADILQECSNGEMATNIFSPDFAPLGGIKVILQNAEKTELVLGRDYTLEYSPSLGHYRILLTADGHQIIQREATTIIKYEIKIGNIEDQPQVPQKVSSIPLLKKQILEVAEWLEQKGAHLSARALLELTQAFKSDYIPSEFVLSVIEKTLHYGFAENEKTLLRSFPGDLLDRIKYADAKSGDILVQCSQAETLAETIISHTTDVDITTQSSHLYTASSPVEETTTMALFGFAHTDLRVLGKVKGKPIRMIVDITPTPDANLSLIPAEFALQFYNHGQNTIDSQMTRVRRLFFRSFPSVLTSEQDIEAAVSYVRKVTMEDLQQSTKQPFYQKVGLVLDYMTANMSRLLKDKSLAELILDYLHTIHNEGQEISRIANNLDLKNHQLRQAVESYFGRDWALYLNYYMTIFNLKDILEKHHGIPSEE